jgi:hypothetical protein
MEWLLLLTLVAGGGAYGARRLAALRSDRRERAEELEAVRHLADEDVTEYGEQLQHLGDDLGERELDVETRRDYQHALDAYEKAKWAAPRLADIDEISALTDLLADGRYAVACVRARVAGEQLPERRVPCFFNPQHGPSYADVMWTTARHGTRRVPGCQQCAARLASREKPDVRTVTIGSRRVPYWEAGSAYLPYTRGYFASEMAGSVGVAWLLAASHDPGPGSFGGGHDQGYGGASYDNSGEGFDSGVGSGGL